MIPTIIENLEQIQQTQKETDGYYSLLVNFILEEAKDSLTGHKQIRPATKYKEYWTEKLSSLWKEMTECERIYRYVKKKGLNSTDRKQTKFREAQWKFHKELKIRKRMHKRGEMIKIESYCTNDSNKFWEYVRNLGPKKNSTIPWKVCVDGEIMVDKNVVLEKWKNDFKNLYDFRDATFNDSFKVDRLLQNQQDPRISLGYNILNEQIQLEEVREAIEKSKKKKAVGLDGVANELLKNESVIRILHCLYCTCFELNVVPDLWHKAIIHPIPKEKKESINLLQYRGFTLQSCIFKIFCHILNARIVRFTDDHETIEDKQNRFIKKQSCQHHIFSLVTMIKNCCYRTSGEELFACFIDFRKAFDVTDRDLLFQRLREIGVSGPFLEISKQIYSNTGSIIRLNGELSKEFESKNRLLQGNNLSTTYFSLYINDLLEELRNSRHGMQTILCWCHPLRTGFKNL